MVRRPVVPDGDVVDGPLEPNLQVVVLGNVSVEVVEQVSRLFGVQVDDTCREAGEVEDELYDCRLACVHRIYSPLVDEKRLVTCNWVCPYEGASNSGENMVL